MIFDMELETLPRDELEKLQLKRLQRQCDRVYANVAFYRKAFDDAGVKPEDIKSLRDLHLLPFTAKQDLRNHYPFGLFAVPKDNVVRIHASSGTTGKATVSGYTQRDINNWATMPDAHSGYGFPIGGVAAFDPDQGGVVCAGGVGFDIACGVRALLTDLTREDVEPLRERLADQLFSRVPSGLGGGGALHLTDRELDRMLVGGAAWAVTQGFGEQADLAAIEDGGTLAGADPTAVSELAKARQRDELGSLGSGNHYLEVQVVEDIFNPEAATVYGLRRDQIVVSIHCGSRGLGHQTATDYIARMAHSLKGAAATMCAPLLREACLDVERAAKDHQTELAVEAFATLESTMA